MHTIRGILMATRRVYHQQFIKSGLPVTENTVGFLPAHAMARISAEYKEWNGNGYRFNNVSDRPRNPANRADAFELAAMDFFSAHPDARERVQPIVETNGTRWFHYTAPIDLNAFEYQRYDPVTIAAVANDEETLALLLQLGASARNVTSPYDGTALIDPEK